MPIIGSTVGDKKVRVSSNDQDSGFLNGKLVAGTNISLVEGNDGANETLTVNATSGAADNFSYKTVATGVTVTVPTYQQMIVHEEITVDGELVADGEVVIID